MACILIITNKHSHCAQSKQQATSKQHQKTHEKVTMSESYTFRLRSPIWAEDFTPWVHNANAPNDLFNSIQSNSMMQSTSVVSTAIDECRATSTNNPIITIIRIRPFANLCTLIGLPKITLPISRFDILYPLIRKTGLGSNLSNLDHTKTNTGLVVNVVSATNHMYVE